MEHADPEQSSKSPAIHKYLFVAPGALVRLLAVTALLSIILGESYGLASRILAVEPWIAALAVHITLAIGILLGRSHFQNEYLPSKLSVSLVGIRAYVPAGAVLLFTCLGALATRALFPTQEQIAYHFDWAPLASISAVPWAEEVVFRLGISTRMQKLGGAIWGSYFATVLFSVVHSDSSLQGWFAGRCGVALGPLLLGAATQILWNRTNRIFPAVALHCACNATAILFSGLDSRWLHWLRALYV